MSFSLIVPAAAHKPEYADHLPPIFHLNEKGVPRCIEAILGLDTENNEVSCWMSIKMIADLGLKQKQNDAPVH